MFLLDGFACSYRLANTGKKQIVALHTPGSFCDLASAYLGASDFNVATVTPAMVVFIPSDLLVRWGQHYAGLGRLLSRITLIEASVSRSGLSTSGIEAPFSARRTCCASWQPASKPPGQRRGRTIPCR